MANVVVVGAGVAGLGAALSLGRAGHHVTVLERDATPLPADPDAAFWWDRRGAPQVRHSHAFLARLRNLLRDRHPDVLQAAARRRGDRAAVHGRHAGHDRRPVAAPGRRGPRRPRLPAHHVRVGAAQGRPGRTRGRAPRRRRGRRPGRHATTRPDCGAPRACTSPTGGRSTATSSSSRAAAAAICRPGSRRSAPRRSRRRTRTPASSTGRASTACSATRRPPRGRSVRISATSSSPCSRATTARSPSPWRPRTKTLSCERCQPRVASTWRRPPCNRSPRGWPPVSASPSRRCTRWRGCATASEPSSAMAARPPSAWWPSATPTRAPTRSTAAGARSRWCTPSCWPTRWPTTPRSTSPSTSPSRPRPQRSSSPGTGPP